MVNLQIRNKYIPSIGIECHVQLKTKTKLFAAVGNDAREADPNTLISHICMGMPGALPVLNEEVLNLAMRTAFAFNTRPQKHSVFERKHYFYPDLPKGYQITQLDQPIVVGGHVSIFVDGKEKQIRLNRVQIEEDAGKNTHPTGKDYSLVDLNRAGTPLLEIVSEPDINSAEEAKAYARELYMLVRFADVSDADMYHGNMRFDVNVSLSTEPGKLGTRTETKNLNSFRSVEKSVEYEINRQIELLEKGEPIVQETRGWDDAKQKTFSQRGKEEAHDYRYFPEPDLPPIELTEDMIKKVEDAMPILPGEWRKRLESLGMDESQVETLLEGELESETVNYLSWIEKSLDKPDFAKTLANWYVNTMIPLHRTDKFKLNDDDHFKLEKAVYELAQANKLSSTNVKALLTDLIQTDTLPGNIEKYAEEKGYIQVSDEHEIAKIVEQVLAANPKAAEEARNGEMKVIGFLVGQVMKESKGKANPQLAQTLLKRELDL